MTVFPRHAAEGTARKCLAVALQQDIHNPLQMLAAYGSLTTALQQLLDSLDAEKAAPKARLAVDPLLREFVADLADKVRKDATEQQHAGADYIHCHGMRTAADRMVEITDQSLRVADEYLAGTKNVKAAA